MRTISVAFALLAVGLLSGAPPSLGLPGSVSVEVTSAGDGDGTCPSATDCTLRAAITYINNSAEPGTPYAIGFAPASFPVSGTTIVLESPLPPVVPDDVTIDTGGLSITVDGSELAGPGAHDGLVLAGTGSTVRGLGIRAFSGSCLVLAGTATVAGGPGPAQGVSVGGCAVGITVSGTGAAVYGASVGFAGPHADALGIGIDVTASDVGVGPASTAGAGSNTIGNAATAIRIGSAAANLSGVSIAGNRIGVDPAGRAAPVGDGITVDRRVVAARVDGNFIAHTSGAGIVVAPDTNGQPAVGVTFSGNSFSDIGTLPVDLGANGTREPNDPDDADSGPNGLQNHPVLTRATAAAVTGTVPGCAGCIVELYLAVHTPGDIQEHAFAPLPGAFAGTGSGGSFVIAAAGWTPGAWVAALATGPDGSSEMGPSARVGVGSLVCEEVAVAAGWNHVPYLGPPVALGDHFPDAGEDTGAITAIYELRAGEGSYRHWFADSSAGRTLSALVPGETYWLYAERAVTLPGTFSFSAPFPVVVSQGWNDFLYLGATADIADVFRDVTAGHGGPFRYDNPPGEWRWSGDAEAPSWTRDFPNIEACRAYHVYTEEPFTLLPPQP